MQLEVNKVYYLFPMECRMSVRQKKNKMIARNFQWNIKKSTRKAIVYKESYAIMVKKYCNYRYWLVTIFQNLSTL